MQCSIVCQNAGSLGPWDLGTIDRTRTYKGRQNRGVIYSKEEKKEARKDPNFKVSLEWDLLLAHGFLRMDDNRLWI